MPQRVHEPAQPDVPTPSPAGGTRSRWLALATIALGVSLIIMDATIVNVALPVVIRDLGLTASQAEWLNASYALVFAALLLTVGRLGDIRGRRRVFALGMVIFMVASVGAGAAQSGDLLIAARVIQGIGAAFILPTTLSSMNALFRGRERAIAFAVYGSTIGGMAAVGPLVGGWLATDVSWRWAFWLNIPFGLLVLAGIMWALPETRDPDAERHLDLVGALFIGVAMAGLVFVLIEAATYGWWLQKDGSLSPVPIVAVVAVISLLAFVRRELVARQHGRVGLVDLGLFRFRSLRYGNIAAAIVAFGEFGLMFSLPLLLQGTLGYSALGAGWLLVSLAIGAFLASGVTPQASRALGQRAVVQIGLALEAIAIAGLALTVSLTVTWWTLAVCLFVYGVGVGMATAQLSSIIMSEVPIAQGGQASGLQSTVRQLGSALGVAVLGTLLVTSLGRGMDSRLSDAGMPVAARDRVVEIVRGSAGAAIPSLGTNPQTAPAAAAARESMVDARRMTSGFAAAALLVGLLATLAIPRPREEESDSTAGPKAGSTAGARHT